MKKLITFLLILLSTSCIKAQDVSLPLTRVMTYVYNDITDKYDDYESLVPDEGVNIVMTDDHHLIITNKKGTNYIIKTAERRKSDGDGYTCTNFEGYDQDGEYVYMTLCTNQGKKNGFLVVVYARKCSITYFF